MKIKIKVKTLVFLGLAFVLMVMVVIPRGNIVLARMLDRWDSPYADVFYQRYLNQSFGSPSFRGKLEYAEALVEGFSRYGLFAAHRGGVIDNRPQDLQRAIDLLEAGIEDEENLKNHEAYFIRGYRLLMDLYITTGDMESFTRGLEIYDGNSLELQELQRVYKSYFEIYFGDLDRGEALLDDAHPAYHIRERETLLAEIALRRGDVPSAKTHLEHGEAHRPDKYRYFDGTIFGTGSFRNQSRWIEKYEENFAGEYTLTGRVTVEGEPMPFVEIYVKEGGDHSWQSAGERMVAITDEDGYFRSIGLRRGSYEVGMGVDSSRLYDKYMATMTGSMGEGPLMITEDTHLEMEFRAPITLRDKGNVTLDDPREAFHLSWKPVPDAAYYRAYYLLFSNPKEHSGGVVQQFMHTREGEEKIFATEAVFTVEGINEKGRVGMVSFSDEDRLLGPTAVLYPILPGIEYPVLIKAFDHDGKEITSSLPLRMDYEGVPGFKLEGELSQGEELILDQQYPEAIEYYSQRLEDQESSSKALRTLSLLYHYGWKQGEEDRGRALDYGEAYYRETGQPQILEMIVDGMSLDEIADRRNRLEDLRSKVDESKEPFDFQHLEAKLHLLDENWEEARKHYLQNDSYLSRNVFYLDLLLEDYESVALRLEDPRFHIYRMNPLVVKDALEDISSQGLTSTDRQKVKVFLETLITEGSDKAENIYRDIQHRIESDALGEVLYHIYLMNNWDRKW